jgi:excisionase family DNA binding protein
MTQEILKKLEHIEALLLEKQKPFFNLNELSLYTGLSRNTLYLKTSTKQIPFHRVGKRLYFSVSEINDWLINEGNKSKSQDEIAAEVDMQVLDKRFS